MQDRFLNRLTASLQSDAGLSEELLIGLGGAYYYRSDTATGTHFNNLDKHRNGFVFVIPTRGPDGIVTIDMFGLRMASIPFNVDQSMFHEYLKLNEQQEPLPWKRHGILDSEGTKLVFRFENDNEADNYLQIFEVSTEPETECPAQFRLTEINTEEVRGEICYSKLGTGSTDIPPEQRAALKFRTVLSDNWIGEWGRRLYATMPRSDQATNDKPLVLIDIVNGSHEKTTEEKKFEKAKEMLARSPEAVIYCAKNTGGLNSHAEFRCTTKALGISPLLIDTIESAEGILDRPFSQLLVLRYLTHMPVVLKQPRG